MRKFELKDAELIKEDGKYYLTTKYTLETDYDIRDVTVTKVPLPLNAYPDVREETPEILWADNSPIAPPSTWYIDLGYGHIMLPGVPESFYTEKVIKEKVQELTLAEIEKKLGHKVKVVSEKKKMPIKCDETCSKCVYDYRRTCMRFGECTNCPMHDDKSKPNCKCNTVLRGDPCPYFEEAK